MLRLRLPDCMGIQADRLSNQVKSKNLPEGVWGKKFMRVNTYFSLIS